MTLEEADKSGNLKQAGKLGMFQLGINVDTQPKPTFNFFDFPLPWNARCLKIFEVTIELDQFLRNVKQKKKIVRLDIICFLWFLTE